MKQVFFNMDPLWILISIVSVLAFCFVQALYINGVKASMETGMILEKVGRRLEKIKYIGKPLAGCIRCMSSIHGASTYWPVVLCLYGFEWWQVPLFVADVFILVVLNWYVYKNL
jgi:hypothetical protein